jgi:hypothetical protein
MLGREQESRSTNPYLGTFVVFSTVADADGRLQPCLMPEEIVCPNSWIAYVTRHVLRWRRYGKPMGPLMGDRPPRPFLQELAGVTSTFDVMAHLAAHNAVDRHMECPIAMEPLASYDVLYVPTCGHICGPEAQHLAGGKPCPVCRASCDWMRVQLTKHYGKD